VLFTVTLMINQVTMMNSMLTGAARYLFVKDGKDARKAVLISIAGFVLLAPIWMIPAMGSAVLFPNLGEMEVFSQLNNANEAAYVAVAMELLPQGLLGLLVCGIFAASLTSMNSLLNVYSGTFVRNFYIQKVNPKASELKQIFVGRVFILIYGLVWMLVALLFKDMKEIKLFDLILKATAMIGLPTALPLTYGMFFRKTPEWAGWGTMVGGFVMAAIAKFGFTKDWLQSIWGQETPLSNYELADLNLALTTGSIFIVCNIVYFGSMLFYKDEKSEYTERVDDFFVELNTPIDRSQDHEPDYEGDKRQYSVLSNLCLAYGGLTLLLLAVPNEMKDRLLIMACGGFVVLVGILLRFVAKKKKPGFQK
jgi:SSS family solute:Na+ symporter